MRKVTVKANQSILDIALQEYGSVDGVFLLMKDNPSVIKSAQNGVDAGTVLKIISSPVDPLVRKYLSSDERTPAGTALVELCPSGSFDQFDTSVWSVSGWTGDAIKTPAVSNHDIVSKALLSKLIAGKTYFLSMNWKRRLKEVDSPASKLVVHLGLDEESPATTLTGASCFILDAPGRYEFTLIAGSGDKEINFYSHNVPGGQEGQFIINEVSVLEIA